MRPRRRLLRLALAALAFALRPDAVAARSGLLVPTLTEGDDVEASTYDEQGVRVGPASLVVERLPEGRMRLVGTSGFTEAARTVVTAVLAPTSDGGALRPLSQESRSVDAEGRPLGVLAIDHERGIGTCTPPDGGEPQRVDLPEQDRVANVLLTQLLRPLAMARSGQLDFDILVCKPSARILSAKARVAPSTQDELVEIETAVELGPMLTQVLRPFLPRVSLWFDPTHAGAWVGHRMPLFSKGPTVLILRAGVTPARLGGALGVP
jgi:hypothetical protein